MTEIDVTDFVNNADTSEYQNSIANSGLNNIGKITWNNAKNSNYHFVTEENRADFLSYFMEYGAWEEEEINTINELNALFIQFLSSDIQTYHYETSENIKHNERTYSLFITDNRYYFPVYN